MEQPRISQFSIARLLVWGSIILAAAYAANFFIPDPWVHWAIANVFHVAGGAYAFFFVRAVFLYTAPSHQTRATWWMELLIFAGGALIIGVFWEWCELLIDRYKLFILREPSIMTYADNIGDLLFDAIGAATAAYFFRKHGKRK